MNAVAMICFNNLNLTKIAVESVFEQDVSDLHIHIVDNGSTDGTREWLADLVKHNSRYSLYVEHKPVNISPVKVANELLYQVFTRAEYVLCLPNDVKIPSNLYAEFKRWPRGFVTGSETGEEHWTMPEKVKAVSENTPMAVMLVRRWAFDALLAKDGHFFDDGYWNYASDCDLALRMAACGIRGVQLNIPYWHYGSASWRTLQPPQQRMVHEQADRDREYFQQKWGFRVTDYEYGQMARDPNFMG